MNYSELLSSYIKNSKMSLSDISEKLKKQGFSTDKGYLSKLQNGKIPPAGEKLNTALADILNGDSDKLELLAYFEKAPEPAKTLFNYIDGDAVDLFVDLARKFPDSEITLFGENHPNIQGSPEYRKILEHLTALIENAAETGEIDFINDIIMDNLEKSFGTFFDFKKYKDVIKDYLKSHGFDSTLEFIKKLVIFSHEYSLDSKVETSLETITDSELLEWYIELPNQGEKKLKKLRKLLEMIED